MPAFSSSGVIVDVEVDREKVLARGARCVSFSSNSSRVSIVIWKVNGKVQHPQPECCLVNAPRHRRGRTALKGAGEAGLTLGQKPGHIDVVV
jgi:hypothetical protein